MVLEQIEKIEASLQRLDLRVPGIAVNEVLLIRLISYLAHGVGQMLEHHVRPFGLGEGEFRVLTALFSQPDSTANPSDLCARATQSPANMSRISDALVGRGLITRVASDEDRRKMVLRITAKGEALVRSVLPSLHAQVREVCGAHTTEEQQQMIAQLKRLAGRLDQVSAAGNPEQVA